MSMYHQSIGAGYIKQSKGKQIMAEQLLVRSTCSCSESLRFFLIV